MVVTKTMSLFWSPKTSNSHRFSLFSLHHTSNDLVTFFHIQTVNVWKEANFLFSKLFFKIQNSYDTFGLNRTKEKNCSTAFLTPRSLPESLVPANVQAKTFLQSRCSIFATNRRNNALMARTPKSHRLFRHTRNHFIMRSFDTQTVDLCEEGNFRFFKTFSNLRSSLRCKLLRHSIVSPKK